MCNGTVYTQACMCNGTVHIGVCICLSACVCVFNTTELLSNASKS